MCLFIYCINLKFFLQYMHIVVVLYNILNCLFYFFLQFFRFKCCDLTDFTVLGYFLRNIESDFKQYFKKQHMYSIRDLLNAMSYNKQ